MGLSFFLGGQLFQEFRRRRKYRRLEENNLL
jgi:hypothetical protein